MKKDGLGRDVEIGKRYFVQKNSRYVGNSVLWWRPAGAGYTTNLKEAGIYKGEDVPYQDEHVPWPVDYVRSLIEHHVDAQRLESGKPKRHKDASSVGSER